MQIILSQHLQELIHEVFSIKTNTVLQNLKLIYEYTLKSKHMDTPSLIYMMTFGLK